MPIKVMPMKLEIKEKRMNDEDLIFENPKIVIPSSSGNGDAIIKLAIKKVSHL